MKSKLNHAKSTICGMFLLFLVATLHAGVTNEWVCAGPDASATNALNWSLLHAPTAGETVLLGPTSTSNMTWAVTNALAGWVQTGGYTGTVTIETKYPGQGVFTNLVITGDCLVEGGVITHPANTGDSIEKERLFMTVNGDFTLGQNAAIDVSGKGYAAGRGPGKSGSAIYDPGATHGGVGGSAANGSAKQLTYGSITSPTNHGSGAGEPGGGTVVIHVGGTAQVDGMIRSVGVPGVGNASCAGAAGGSIWLTAATVSGGGTLDVSGLNGSYGGAGGGGRIAVVLGEGISTGDVLLKATGGTATVSGTPCGSGAGTIYVETAAHKPGRGRLIVANAGYTPLPSNRGYTLMPLAGQFREGPVNLDDFAEIVISGMGVLAINSDTIMTNFSTG